MTADHRKPAYHAKTKYDPLAEMIALTTADTAADSKIADALAEMERLSTADAAYSGRNSAADTAALAEFEELITPEPRKKPSTADGAATYPEPRYSVQVERALYQSQIDLVNAFRPSPRKRRRDFGYDR